MARWPRLCLSSERRGKPCRTTPGPVEPHRPCRSSRACADRDLGAGRRCLARLIRAA
jgi:hypothetical protein